MNETKKSHMFINVQDKVLLYMSETCLKLENITTNIKIYKLHSFENERFF